MTHPLFRGRRPSRQAGQWLAATLLLAGLLTGVALPADAAPPTARIDVPGLDGPVTVIRDGRGIPHIFATNAHDLYFMQGWVHAEDRMFQMDLTRRQPSGTLAEVLGPDALPSDVQLRTIGLRRSAQRSLANVSDQAKADLTAYSEGVNAWLAANPLPLEYTVLEITSVEPWTPVDSLVIAKLIAFGLSFDLDITATVNLGTYQATGQALGFDGTALYFEDVFRSAPFDPASTVPDATAAPGPPGPPGPPGQPGPPGPKLKLGADEARVASVRIDPTTLRLARNYLERARQVPALASALAPTERIQGSNEWAMSGSLTADGRPLMANDPHLALNTPATFHQIHLRAPAHDVDVMGSGFPGTPYVILGQNRRITWGATTNPMDVTDTYQEMVVPDAASPSGLSTVYLGQQEPVIPIPETFRFNLLDGTPDNLGTAGAAQGVPPATLIVPRRNNGPILELDTDTGAALSVQYTGFSGTREIDAFRIWNQAKGIHRFQEGLQYFDFGSQNWAYADIEGNIAYFTSAEMPIREDLQAGGVNGLPPFFIRDGTGGNEWLPAPADRPDHHAVPYQVLSMEEMPHVINPPRGWFVNANNDPAGTTLDNNPLNQLRPGGGIYYLNPGYAQGTRAGRITDRIEALAARGHVTPEDMMDIQADVVLLDAQVFTPYITGAYDRQATQVPVSAEVQEAMERLRIWNRSFPTGIAEGFDASDVNGVRKAPSAEEIANSVAATLFSVWRGQIIGLTLDATLAPRGLPTPGSRDSIIALRHLFETGGVGASGLDFFANGLGTSDETKRDTLVLQALQQALDLLAGPDFADAFAGSTDQDDYRWGLLHRIVLDHPLGGPFSIPPAGGAFEPTLPPNLTGIPVDGGFGAVDASSHSARADSVNEFMFGSGPVRRYVASPSVNPGGIMAWTAMPGGESGVLGHPFYFNLLPRWLTNDAYPVVQGIGEVQSGALIRFIYRPAK